MNRKVVAILSISAMILSAFAATTMVETVNASPWNAGTVYTIDNASPTNHVLYFSRSWDGSLSFGGSVSTGDSGTGATLHPQGAVVLTADGNFLLAVNAGSNSISVFRVLRNGTPVLCSTTSSHGDVPISLTVHGNLVYVLNAETPNIAGFRLSRYGTLNLIASSIQPLSGQPNPNPEQIGFSPLGNLLVVTELGTNLIDTYKVNWYGAASGPKIHASAGMAPYGFAFANLNTLVVSEASNSLSSYAVSFRGDLRTISSAVYTGEDGNTPCWVAINDWGWGRHAYVGNGGSGTISSYSISFFGRLDLLDSAAATANPPTLDLAFSKWSNFLYVLAGGYITGYQVFGDGSLLQVTSIDTGVMTGTGTGLAAT